MQADIYIKNNQTGEVRVYHQNDYRGAFPWTDGNWSCDCNRHLFFERCVNPNYDEDFPCGEDAYSVEIKELR